VGVGRVGWEDTVRDLLNRRLQSCRRGHVTCACWARAPRHGDWFSAILEVWIRNVWGTHYGGTRESVRPVVTSVFTICLHFSVSDIRSGGISQKYAPVIHWAGLTESRCLQMLGGTENDSTIDPSQIEPSIPQARAQSELHTRKVLYASDASRVSAHHWVPYTFPPGSLQIELPTIGPRTFWPRNRSIPEAHCDANSTLGRTLAAHRNRRERHWNNRSTTRPPRRRLRETAEHHQTEWAEDSRAAHHHKQCAKRATGPRSNNQQPHEPNGDTRCTNIAERQNDRESTTTAGPRPTEPSTREHHSGARTTHHAQSGGTNRENSASSEPSTDRKTDHGPSRPRCRSPPWCQHDHEKTRTATPTRDTERRSRSIRERNMETIDDSTQNRRDDSGIHASPDPCETDRTEALRDP